MSIMKIAILLGSIRAARQSHKVGYYLKEELSKRSIDADLIDLAETPLPIFGAEVNEPDITQRIRSIGDTLGDADALIFVTPEYHGSFSGALKNALDFYGSEFSKKPIGVAAASAGRMGGINASVQLQHVILSLGAYPLPLKLIVPEVQNAFDDSVGKPKESVTRSASRFINEFLWFAEAISLKKMQRYQYDNQ
jgi:azobenzene reductase